MDLAQLLQSVTKEIQQLGHPLIPAILEGRDGAAKLLIELPKLFPVEKIKEERAQRVWELCGVYFQHQGRFHEAIAIHHALYEHLLAHQEAAAIRLHKGTPLVWISDCHAGLGHPVLSKRYLMLTTCEDALAHQGTIPADKTGVYFRIVWRHGMSDAELSRYARAMWEILQRSPESSVFPEWILQQLDQAWMVEYPSVQETSFYRITPRYANWLLRRCGQGDGKSLELLAEYLVSAMPGCHTSRRKRSYSTDYDLVCALDGTDLDFRSELGRYFVAECKDWAIPADFTVFAKFCRVLDSVKCRFGILFSRNGISGAGRMTDAEREQLKVYQDRGMVIVVVSEADLRRIADGENFIAMLRRKYEEVRLDLRRDP